MTPRHYSQEALTSAVAANTLPHIAPRADTIPSHGIMAVSEDSPIKRPRPKSETCPRCHHQVDRLVPALDGSGESICLDCYEKSRATATLQPVLRVSVPEPLRILARFIWQRISWRRILSLHITLTLTREFTRLVSFLALPPGPMVEAKDDPAESKPRYDWEHLEPCVLDLSSVVNRLEVELVPVFDNELDRARYERERRAQVAAELRVAA